MKIKVKDISKEGLSLEETQTGKDLDLEREDIKFIEPLRIKVRVEKGRDSIQVYINVESRMQFFCNRCLQECERDLKKRFNMMRPTAQDAVIDMTEMVREEIMLDHPLKFLCKQDCQGLCPGCGKNLNEGVCNCKKHKEGLANRAKLRDIPF